MARNLMGEVVWILPRAFPHKGFDGASFEARCRMLEILANQEEGFSAAVSDGGLYAEIAEEARAYFGSEVEIALVCGRDAAERIAAWDYGSPGFFDEFVRRYRLLVAARTGEYKPAENHAGRIIALPMESSSLRNLDDVSSSEVRRRLAAGEDWRGIVPTAIGDIIETLY